VIDGSGAPAQKVNVAIQAGRIAAVGTGKFSARETVDLDGLVLAPGFLDIHAHSDYEPLLDPEGLSRIHDGVVLEVSGNCGMSPFPLCDLEAEHEVAAFPGLEVGWRDMEGYLDALRERGMGLSRTWLVGHGTLRARVVGHQDRPPTATELEEMKSLLEDCLDRGAAGFSTGLIYAPGCYANVDEIAALSEVVQRRGRLYASHIRGEGETLLEAIDEILEVTRRTGVRTQVSHLKASKPENWHKLGEAIVRIETARGEGYDVMADRYPYTATCTGLHAILPEWALEGGNHATVERCREGRPEREKILHYLRGRHPLPYWERVQIGTLGPASDRSGEGRRVSEIAAGRGIPVYETALDLIAESQDQASAVYHVLDEENLQRVLRLPWVMIGSDGSACSTRGPTATGRPHPRTFGTFARVLGRYVRELGVLSLEEAVQKMTSMPASRVGLGDRGRISPGAWADLVAFDPDTVEDRATFEEPFAYSRGMQFLWIKGRKVLSDGEYTQSLEGEPVLAHV
jgi:N-acyl-D-amino-acid deacylase